MIVKLLTQYDQFSPRHNYSWSNNLLFLLFHLTTIIFILNSQEQPLTQLRRMIIVLVKVLLRYHMFMVLTDYSVLIYRYDPCFSMKDPALLLFSQLIPNIFPCYRSGNDFVVLMALEVFKLVSYVSWAMLKVGVGETWIVFIQFAFVNRFGEAGGLRHVV
jgi:hypothetical protein